MRQRSGIRHRWWIGLACLGCVLHHTDAAAQGPSGAPLTLNDAIQLALKNYPAIKESRARAQTSLAKPQSALTDVDVAAAAADAFLTVLAADESVRAARANVDRLQVFSNNVRTLVQNQLRPGADQSRAEAELAVANNQMSQAVQIAEVARASLADAVGAAGASFELTAGVLTAVPEFTIEPADLTTHPAARAGQAAIDVVRARERTLDRAYYPHITLQSTF